MLIQHGIGRDDNVHFAHTAALFEPRSSAPASGWTSSRRSSSRTATMGFDITGPASTCSSSSTKLLREEKDRLPAKKDVHGGPGARAGARTRKPPKTLPANVLQETQYAARFQMGGAFEAILR